jgi:succinate dehydrogenase / fumarate reductase cytochrome b subunit
VPAAEHRVAEQSAATIDEAAERPGRWLREVWASTIGKKLIVAITGVILTLYVILHALGNLKAIQGTGGGQPAIDRYAEWLRTVGEPAIPRNGVLWTIRVILIAALVLHVVGIWQLTARNRAARPPEHRSQPIARTWASRTMLFTGIAILAFVVFHVLQFTTRTIQVTPIYQGTVYANLYEAFQKWYFVLIYVGAVSLLGLHLRHAIWSVTQTAGIDKPNRNPTFRRTANVVAGGVAVGFAAIPLLFWVGALPDPYSSSQATAPPAAHAETR